MNKLLPDTGCRSPIQVGGASPRPSTGNRCSAGFPACGIAGLSSPAVHRVNRYIAKPPFSSRITHHASRRRAFSMVELLVSMTLLTLIVFALMAVFTSTQRAFRASVTQTGILEGGRSTVDMITSDLRTMAPSDGQSNFIYNNTYNYGAVNFFASTNNYYYSQDQYQPLLQPLPGSSVQRFNQLEYFFMLGKDNTKWTGIGYVVNSGSSSPLYPLYRFYEETNVAFNPYLLYSNFLYNVSYDFYYLPSSPWTNLSHMIDGVVHLTVDAYDANGYRMTNTYQWHGPLFVTNRNIQFAFPALTLESEVGFAFFSNAVPAAVELQFGLLEDRTLQRAESLGIAGSAPASVPAQWSYLQQQAGHVELFRQRVTIPNVDYTAYQ